VLPVIFLDDGVIASLACTQSLFCSCGSFLEFLGVQEKTPSILFLKTGFQRQAPCAACLIPQMFRRGWTVKFHRNTQPAPGVMYQIYFALASQIPIASLQREFFGLVPDRSLPDPTATLRYLM
jgi:hypothetical protein